MLKLTDFGFAKETTQNALQTPCYTPYYVGESSGMVCPPPPPFPHTAPRCGVGRRWVAEAKGLTPGSEGGVICVHGGSEVGGRRLQKYSSELQLLLLKIDPGKFWLRPVSRMTSRQL